MAHSARSLDQLVAIHNVSWQQYHVITEAIGDSGSPRTTYLEGELNIMSPGRAHESLKKLFSRLVFAWADFHELSLNGFGGVTLRKEADEAGLEPDECYSLGHGREIPDLAIEIVITSGTIDKLEVYARLGCREVWRWDDGKIQVHGLARDGSYRKRRASEVLRGFPLGDVERILRTTDPARQSEAVRAFRKSLG